MRAPSAAPRGQTRSQDEGRAAWLCMWRRERLGDVEEDGQRVAVAPYIEGRGANQGGSPTLGSLERAVSEKYWPSSLRSPLGDTTMMTSPRLSSCRVRPTRGAQDGFGVLIERAETEIVLILEVVAYQVDREPEVRPGKGGNVVQIVFEKLDFRSSHGVLLSPWDQVTIAGV